MHIFNILGHQHSFLTPPRPAPMFRPLFALQPADIQLLLSGAEIFRYPLRCGLANRVGFDVPRAKGV